eukprot:1180581-Prorocentrum_minimum.AAC.2
MPSGTKKPALDYWCRPRADGVPSKSWRDIPPLVPNKQVILVYPSKEYVPGVWGAEPSPLGHFACAVRVQPALLIATIFYWPSSWEPISVQSHDKAVTLSTSRTGKQLLEAVVELADDGEDHNESVAVNQQTIDNRKLPCPYGGSWGSRGTPRPTI